MKKILLALTSVLLVSASALACHITGKIACPNEFVVTNVTLNITGPAGFNESVQTDMTGTYIVTLPGPGTYTITIDAATMPANTSIVGGLTETVDVAYGATVTVNFVATGDACGVGCWMTGGGALVDPLLGIPVATKGGHRNKPLHSFGGNVYPGCSPTAGDGGNWNHVARGTIKLHFHGTDITVVQCGNVTPPPDAGSSSPKTPYNFIEFEGTGTLKGIQGNKANYGTVHFFGRVEDRNEPGSTGPSSGALVDRYYLRVWDSTGKVRLLVNGTDDETAAGMDPTPISDGNLQLHISSCDKPPTP